MAEKEKRESWKKSKIGIEKMCLHQAITQLTNVVQLFNTTRKCGPDYRQTNLRKQTLIGWKLKVILSTTALSQQTHLIFIGKKILSSHLIEINHTTLSSWYMVTTYQTIDQLINHLKIINNITVIFKRHILNTLTNKTSNKIIKNTIYPAIFFFYKTRYPAKYL